MKRRALLLGALFFPMAAHARTPKKAVKKAAPRAPAKAAEPAVVAREPPGPPPLKEAKSQLIAFNASPFPYSGLIPGTNKPFLDVRDGKRRGHTTLRGDICWEDTTYSDRRSLLYLPPGYNPQRPSLIVLFLHGQGATLERDVMARQAVPRQIAESGKNVALVAPQLAVDAADSSAGNFWRPGYLATYIDEAAERLMRLYGDKRAGPHFNAAPVIIVSYSGGYLSTAYALERGGALYRVKGVVLLDSLYGDEEKFAGWAATRRQTGFLLSAYTESTRDSNATLESLLARRRVPYASTLPRTLTPGTVAFVGCGSADLHGDFVTHAWSTDPVKHALAMIPGYEPVAPPEPPKAVPAKAVPSKPAPRKPAPSKPKPKPAPAVRARKKV
ncbi:MAG: alpha/beta hydrolase [Alphaproteobacteria bacterium]|nr:alpha/beta hydrolase [Alphaproteobacteria bacterium]